jgi:hypothetical protein
MTMTEVRIEFDGAGKATRCTVDGEPATLAEVQEAIRRNQDERERRWREFVTAEAVRK